MLLVVGRQVDSLSDNVRRMEVAGTTPSGHPSDRQDIFFSECGIYDNTESSVRTMIHSTNFLRFLSLLEYVIPKVHDLSENGSKLINLASSSKNETRIRTRTYISTSDQPS